MTVGAPTQLLAFLLYLLPVGIVVAALLRRRTAPDELALWIPATVAADVLTCLVLARLVALDVAFLISRALWVAGGALWIARARRHIARPESLDRRRLLVIGATGIAAFTLSFCISRYYSIWDRQFHIGLVTTIRGQRLPFLNVFQPHAVLHYHFAGDVVAAALQTFSGGAAHGSLALAMAHDVMFGLTGLCVAAALVSMASPRLWIIPAVLTVFFMGPLALMRVGLGSQLIGYSILSLLCMSFRPHVSLSILLLAGVFLALVRASDGRARRPAETMIPLALCVLALGLTDEASAALTGVGLAATWLFFPHLFGGRRWRGLVGLLAIGAGILAVNVLFQSSLAPGGPVQAVRLTSWRSPGYGESPLPLAERDGLYALVTDLGAFVAVFAAAIGFSLRGPRSRKALVVFLGSVLAVATFGLCRIEVNGMHLESHRFATICEILFGLAAVILVARLPAGSWERVPIIGTVAVAVVSTIFWMQAGMGPPEELYTNVVDCRTAAGTRLFEKPQPTYIPRSHWFDYAGCRPVFSPGVPISWERLYVGGPVEGRGALAALHRDYVRPGAELTAACPVDYRGDPACELGRSQRRCTRVGTGFELCKLSAADREKLLAQAW